jgi:hypothetical protein
MSKAPYEHKEGRGSMFQNTRKEKDTHPDWRGDIMINGTVMEICSWWNEEKGFHSLSITEKKPFTPGETQQRSDRQEQRQSAPPMRQERQDGSRRSEYRENSQTRSAPPKRETMDTVFTSDSEDIPF